MTTIVSRMFASTPARDAHDTWLRIVDFLAGTSPSADRDALLAVSGTAASLISDQAPKDAPIVVTCDGPRTRLYCIYDDDAVEGSDANEGVLGYDPLNGDWALSLPCFAEDLGWVRGALAAHGGRITARDVADGITIAAEGASSSGALVFDAEGFVGS